MVVTAEVDGASLRGKKLGVDLRLIGDQLTGDCVEPPLQLRIARLVSQRKSPVQREVEMAPAIVDLAHLARRRPVVVKELRDRLIERVGKDLCLLVLERCGQMLERRGQSGKLAERIPAQVALFDELLDVLRCGTAGAGLEKTSSGQQRHD